MIHVGTSGWQYDHWRGVLYPEGLSKEAWLRRFAEAFATVEVNNSFYRLPSEESFARWRDQTPERFVFAVKASRFITHIKRLRECREPVELFWSRMACLEDKRGPVLFQLPPNLEAVPERLEAFLGVLPAGMRPAFEFRHPSWEREEIHALLDSAGAALVLADRPGARVAQVVTGGWSYLRFHAGRRDAPGYRREKLVTWAERILDLPAADVYVYFNNDPEGAAIHDARVLKELLAERGATLARI